MALNIYTESEKEELKNLTNKIFYDDTDINCITKKISNIMQKSCERSKSFYEMQEEKLNNLINK
jgi:hypothetical protein